VIPDSFKQDLLNRVDIVDVVSRYVQLKKGGANYLGLCPFHNEKTPSFSVSPAKQFYHCFGCGVHGNAIGFLMAYSALGYIDAVKELASSVGMQVPESRPPTPQEAARKERETDLYAVMEKAMDFYRTELKKSPRAIEYLKGRGLTGEIAARFRMGYAPEGWQGLKTAFPEYADKALVEAGLVIEGDEGKRYDRFRDRVMFPILSARGAVIGFGGRVMGDGEPKYLNSPETPLFQKGQELYGLVQARDAINLARRVLVVEGYMDVVALAQFGVSYAVATLGTATTANHVVKLKKLSEEIVFCFDGDAAGRKAAWRALEVSIPLVEDRKPIKFLFLPEADDPDTFVRREGKDAFEALIRQAPTLSEFLVAELRSQVNLASPEGRNLFLANAKPHVQRVTAAGLRLQLVKELAPLGHVTQEEAEELFEIRRGPSYKRAGIPKALIPSKPLPIEVQLLRWVLVAPKAATEMDMSLMDSGLPEAEVLRELLDLGTEYPPEQLTQPFLLEKFRGSPYEPILVTAQERIVEFNVREDLAEQEIGMCMLNLRMQRTNDEIELLKKAVTADPRDKPKQLLLASKLRDLTQMKDMKSKGEPWIVGMESARSEARPN